jgi:chemotaxis protein MotA
VATQDLFLDTSSQEEVDRGTLLGVAGAFGLVLLAMWLGGGLAIFFDLNSFLIVVGGTIGATLVTFPISDVSRALLVLRTAFFPGVSPAELRLKKLLALSEKARTHGVLSLQEEAYREADPFLLKCIELVIDELPNEDIRRILEFEIMFLSDRHRRGAQIFQTMGTVAPAMGLIGTLIGLVQMLRNLEDAASLGPNMAIALITTFYGAVLSTLVFLPIAGKLRSRSEEETLVKEMTLEGMLGIASGANPRILEEALLSFLPPEKRRSRYR